MREALVLARSTPPGDIPVGALLLDPGGEVIGRGTNRREADMDPLAHAEILAIREATPKLTDRWRLTDCTLVVTLEPCAMCAGALVGARVGRIFFGAFEPKTGACGSVWDLPRDGLALHHPQVMGGVLEDECAQLLTDFFAGVRGQD